jgi:hypothetical protein
MALLNPASGVNNQLVNRQQRRPQPAECRILRYPNGEERRICYPVELADSDEPSDYEVRVQQATVAPPPPAPAPIVQPPNQPQVGLMVCWAKQFPVATTFDKRCLFLCPGRPATVCGLLKASTPGSPAWRARERQFQGALKL